MQLMKYGSLLKITIAILSFGCSYQPDDSILMVVDSSPRDRAEIGADEPIIVMFSDYLSFSSLFTDGIELSSGELKVDVQLAYDPVDRAIVIKPKKNLRVGVGYSLKIERDSIQDLSGHRRNEDYRLNFRTGRPIGFSTQPISYESDIKPIFLKQCGCHGFEDQIAPDLSRWQSLLGQPSARQPEVHLISAGEPLSSYLVLRLLPDYPAILGPSKAISENDAKRVVTWVTHLAP